MGGEEPTWSWSLWELLCALDLELGPDRPEEQKGPGSGGIRTHAPEETGALIQRLRPLGHATSHRLRFYVRIIWPKLWPISGPFPPSRLPPTTPPPLCTVPGALLPAFPSPLPPQPENPLAPDTLLSHGSQVHLEWWRRKRHLPHLSPIQGKGATQTESSSGCCGLQIHLETGVSPRTTGVSKSGSLVWAWRKADKEKRKESRGSRLSRPPSSSQETKLLQGTSWGRQRVQSLLLKSCLLLRISASPQVLVTANRISAKSRFSCPYRP